MPRDHIEISGQDTTPQLHPGTLLELATPTALRAGHTLDRAIRNEGHAVPETLALAADLEAQGGVAALLAHRAAAIALRTEGDVATSLEHAERAVALAAEMGHAIALSEAQGTHALSLAASGFGTEAVRAVTASVTTAQGHEHATARARAQKGLVLQRMGLRNWESEHATALPVLEAQHDHYWVGLICLNRGTALIYTGRLREARDDLQRAKSLLMEADDRSGAAFAIHNLGYAASRAGDVPEALRAFEEAAAHLIPLGVDMTPAILDRSETLLISGLTEDAIALLSSSTIENQQPALDPECQLLLARAYWASGNLATSSRTAAAAQAAFLQQGRRGWALHAQGVHAIGALSLGEVTPNEAASIADGAEAGGWPDVAAEVRTAAALRCAEEGDTELARLLVEPLLETDDLPLVPRLGLALAQMALSQQDGDHTGVLEHATRALARLDERRVLLGASELRAHVTRLAEDILTRATLAALELGDLDRALEWVDRARSQALDQPPVVPPEDEQLADDLGRLRVLSDQLARKRAEGEAVTNLLIKKDELERRVRDRARTASGTRTNASTASARQPATTEVAYLDLGDHLAALIASDAGTRRVDLAVDRGTIVHELDALGFAMQRVGASRAPGRRRDLAARSLNHSLTTLDNALVTPLGLPADGEVVISPTSVLFDVPWSGLPDLMDRPVAVAPALRLSRRPHREDAGTGTLLLEGPRLAHARAELDALAEVVADPRTILGEEGTVAAAKEALPEVAIGHLACHGVFRADNPQFSSLELADGPMFVYDLESLPRVPDLIVLSACQTGRSAVHVGDELLGVTASLLALGARTVVAALADVPDDLSALLMLAFHQHVRAGAGPAEALAHARRTLLATRDEPAARLTAAAFVCLGAP